MHYGYDDNDKVEAYDSSDTNIFWNLGIILICLTPIMWFVMVLDALTEIISFTSIHFVHLYSFHIKYSKF
jgi:hypothetical protein